LGRPVDIPHHGAPYLRLVNTPHGTGLISYKSRQNWPRAAIRPTGAPAWSISA